MKVQLNVSAYMTHSFSLACRSILLAEEKLGCPLFQKVNELEFFIIH